MKTKLLITQQQTYTIYALLVFCLCFNYGWSQNLMLNPTCDEHGTSPGSLGSTTDNADSYDMTPNNTIKDEMGNDVPSPYQAIWDNDPLQDYIEGLYNGGNNLDEQPGSTSNGNGGTRGVKLYNDGSPVAQGVCTRRIYQKVEGLTIGLDYTFSVDSRSEAMGVPSEVFMLNEEISTEVGLENGAADPRVDAFLNITNDFNSDSSVFTNNSITFTASNTFVVVYIRALGATAENNETFYDNFSLVEEVLSVDDVLASSFNVYPNPVNNYLHIESNDLEISSVRIFDLLGKEVLRTDKLNNNKLNVESISKGVYILKINSNDRSVAKKIIIE